MKVPSCDIWIVSSVSRRFGLVARFPFAMKKKKKKVNFVVRALKTKQVGNGFSSMAAKKIRSW